VEQKGSLVDATSLRFDFSHFQKVTPEELRQVEHVANMMVRQAIARDEHRNVPIDEAKAMGAMALFGEKYGDRVRVIRYGDSVELCGGTHVPNTGNIGLIHIVSESSIAAGVRRIEAVTAEATESLFDTVLDTIHDIKTMLNNAPDAIVALKKSLTENATLRRQAEGFVQERINTIKDVAKQHVTHEGTIDVMMLRGIMMPEVVKGVAFAIKAEGIEHTALLGATEHEGKPMLTVLLSEDLVKAGLNAGKIVREAAKHIQGGGGGQPHFAQAGGRSTEGLTQALDAMREALKQ
ncbi:MAG: alanine--tRNA ligase, partial [Muribaculaceae bacterium]|nr:alanine--tRNA ligase [Muribaculaceae bacterium]